MYSLTSCWITVHRRLVRPNSWASIKKMYIVTNECSVIEISYGVLVNGPNRNENIAKIHNFWPILACLTILEILFWQKKVPMQHLGSISSQKIEIITN